MSSAEAIRHQFAFPIRVLYWVSPICQKLLHCEHRNQTLPVIFQSNKFLGSSSRQMVKKILFIRVIVVNCCEGFVERLHVFFFCCESIISRPLVLKYEDFWNMNNTIEGRVFAWWNEFKTLKKCTCLQGWLFATIWLKFILKMACCPEGEKKQWLNQQAKQKKKSLVQHSYC